MDKGSSHTGDVARTFFRTWKESLKVTEINQDLIIRFGIFLVALSSGFELDNNTFKPDVNLLEEALVSYKF